MTIGGRLGLLVAISVLGLVGGGIFGVMKLNATQDMFGSMTSRVVPALKASHMASDGFKETRAVLLALLMEEDPDLQQAFGQKIKASKDLLIENVQQLKTNPETAESAADLLELAGKYSDAVESTIQVARHRDAAQLALYTKVVPAEKQLNDKLLAVNEHLKTVESALQSEIESDSARAVTIYTLSMTLIVLAVSALGYFVYQSVMRPIGAMTKAMTDVSEKLDFTVSLDHASNDELSHAIGAFNGLLASVRHSLRDIHGAMGSLAQETSSLRHAAGEMDRISTASNQASTSVAEIVREVTDNISQLTEKTIDAEGIARESGQQAERSTETITTTISQIRQISEIVHSAATDIESLRSRVDNIHSVVGVIRDVADQTNLLALNAAIEAARAGEAGRGFAVVADEVRKLAERTAHSTQEISQLISDVQSSSEVAATTMNSVVTQVETGVESASGAIEALTTIRESADRVLNTVSDIAGGIRAQRDAVTHIREQFSAIAQSSSETAEASTSTSQSTQKLESLASSINQTVQRYRIG